MGTLRDAFLYPHPSLLACRDNMTGLITILPFVPAIISIPILTKGCWEVSNDNFGMSLILEGSLDSEYQKPYFRAIFQIYMGIVQRNIVFCSIYTIIHFIHPKNIQWQSTHISGNVFTFLVSYSLSAINWLTKKFLSPPEFPITYFNDAQHWHQQTIFIQKVHVRLGLLLLTKFSTFGYKWPASKKLPSKEGKTPLSTLSILSLIHWWSVSSHFSIMTIRLRSPSTLSITS